MLTSGTGGRAGMSYPVALFDPRDAHYNTISLQGVDIIIPLEEDLDCDPLQDDEIRLLALDGSYEKIVKASDSDAVPDDERGITASDRSRWDSTGFRSL
jgi:hypothetical protein